MTRASLAALLVGCGPAGWGAPVPVTSHDGWREAGADNPFGERPADLYCDSSAWGPADFAPGEVAFDVQTQFCSWLTVEQASSLEIGARDRLYLRLFHERLTAWDEGVGANIGLGVGDDVVWTTWVPIPGDAGFVFADVDLPRAIPAGTMLAFHLDNHGANSYHLLEVSRRPPVPADEAVEVTP